MTETKFPAVAYHENGTSVAVASAADAKTLGEGYSDKPNDNTIKNLRKACGAARTDPMPGVISHGSMETY